MNRRNFLRLAAMGAAGAGQHPLNFVFVMVDDLGWTDLACYGSRFYETPHIDRLASQGMRFTNAYAAAPLCSPTRASIMTGQYPARLNLTYALGVPLVSRPGERLRSPEIAAGLPPGEVTIAEALKPAGYVSALVGKWHLGDGAMRPEIQGFDLNAGGSHVGMPTSYFYPEWKESREGPTSVRGGIALEGRPGEYLTDRLTGVASDFLERHRDRQFLLCLSHYGVHTPLEAPEGEVAAFRKKLKSGEPHNNPVYAAMIRTVDRSVGRVLAKLEELRVADRTVVFFMSDNGGLAHREGRDGPATSNAPLREGKHFLYEGGIREPLIVRWPGAVRPGSVCDVPVISNDFFPTMLDMAGLPARRVDGASLVPLLRGGRKPPHDALFWHSPHYGKHGALPGSAVRKGDYKLIVSFDPEGVELYNLARDIGEKDNLAGREPGKAKELRALLEAWRRSVNARMMVPNPAWRPPQ